ncbi:MAG: hypothetical protein ACK4RV_17575 [Caulobacter sp.]
MSDFDRDTKVYEVRRERRAEIERTLTDPGRHEWQLSNDLQKELCRYLVGGGIGAIALFKTLGLSGQAFWGVAAGCAISTIIAFTSMFLRSQGHYHDGNHYFVLARKNLVQMDGGPWSAREEAELAAENLLAKRYKAAAMICFFSAATVLAGIATIGVVLLVTR